MLSSSLSNAPGFKNIHIVEISSRIHEDPVEALELFLSAGFDEAKAVTLRLQREAMAKRKLALNEIAAMAAEIRRLDHLGTPAGWQAKQKLLTKRKDLRKSL